MAAEPERRCGGVVVDPVNGLYFEEVIAGAEAAQLTEPSLEGPEADLAGVSAIDLAAVLAALQVTTYAVPRFHRVARAAEQHLLQLRAARQLRGTAPVQPAGDGVAERVHERSEPGGQFIAIESGDEQSYTARDVETDPAR